MTLCAVSRKIKVGFPLFPYFYFGKNLVCAVLRTLNAVRKASSVYAEPCQSGHERRVGAYVDSRCTAFYDNDLFGHKINIALVIPANRTGKDDPIAFPVADALVLI